MVCVREFVGPCKGTVVEGYPRLSYSEGSDAETSVQYRVRTSDRCEFLKCLFGDWNCIVGVDGVSTFQPLQLNEGWAIPCRDTSMYQMEASSVKWVPKGAIVCPLSLDEFGAPVPDIEDQRWETKIQDELRPAVATADVQYRYVTRFAPDEFRVRVDCNGDQLVSSPPAGEDPPEEQFGVPWPATIEVTRQTALDLRTYRTQELYYCHPGTQPPECCKKLPAGEDGYQQLFDPISTEVITVLVKNHPCPNFKILDAYKGNVADHGFLGYPALGVMFMGYDDRSRYDVLGRRVWDLQLNFLAKTLPSNGETDQFGYVHECVNGRVGFWGRSRCEAAVPGTTQYWWPVCKSEGGSDFIYPILTSPESFQDLVNYEATLPLP